tara:strand:- start:5167 stop:6219 length:1053 start_codon:yes stop_codon:yes gene_type:complete
MTNSKLIIGKNKTIEECLKLMKKGNVKCLVVCDKEYLKGTISDGDIRKAFLNGKSLSSKINNIYNSSCKYLLNESNFKEKLKKLLINQRYDVVPIINKQKKIIDVISWHDLKEKEKRKLSKISLPVIIMAGGLGTRLKPFTDVLPKPLVPINDKTIIENIIENFKKHSVKEFYISLNYKSKIIKSYLRETYPKLKFNFLEEKSKLGTIGSLSLFKARKKHFFVTNCDILVDIDYNSLYQHHKNNNSDLTIVVCKMSFSIPYGTVSIKSNGEIKKLNEKPKSEYFVNTGLYIFKDEIIKIIPKNKNFDFDVLIDKCLKSGLKVGTYIIDHSRWHDVGEWINYGKTINNFNK